MPLAIQHTRLIVGLEIHVELCTRSKMFTRAPNPAHVDFDGSEPNSLVDPLVAALPGTLPVMNRAAVEMAVRVGMALECAIAGQCRWDRKNYFYPDLPKGYQISQYDQPLCGEGKFELPLEDGTTKSIGIIRAHLEEDTGKLGHELPGGRKYDGSLVDLNRAGTPLLEIVTAPDFSTAGEVVAFAQALRVLCRFLGVTEGVMQKGHMRFEPNINVEITLADGSAVRTPIVEVKNLNSFKAVRGAIEYEHIRQVEAWKQDGRVMGRGMKATRGWLDEKNETVLQREKEDAHDYRYFPDPDLVPVRVDAAWQKHIRDSLIEPPLRRQRRYQQEWGLLPIDAENLVAERPDCLYFEECVAAAGSTPAAGFAVGKLLLNAGSKRANEKKVLIHQLGAKPARVAELVKLRESNEVGPQAADHLFGFMCDSDEPVRVLAEKHGLLQVRDDSALDAWVEEAIQAQPQAAADVAAGKDAATGRLVGHVMKLSKGKADAKSINERLLKRLRK
ncbi:MAG: Asp-tRNA(Asn)/Glu-tRNA(Gln) amidotransferase subunit GatB [Planctomycetes bacterium]|nr:Asp-tRNA(Asn)/Glu-tRNA(Gln) amidotransferase subunit GatB [Planctomycetota bacterium]